MQYFTAQKVNSRICLSENLATLEVEERDATCCIARKLVSTLLLAKPPTGFKIDVYLLNILYKCPDESSDETRRQIQSRD